MKEDKLQNILFSYYRPFDRKSKIRKKSFSMKADTDNMLKVHLLVFRKSFTQKISPSKIKAYSDFILQKSFRYKKIGSMLK